MINSSGKNLFPVKIESTVKECSPLVGHVAVIADRRRFVSALIVPDHEQLGAFDDVDGEIARAIEEANAKLSRVERIRAFKILDTDWRPGGPELTNTMKLRRAAIEERYADVIEELYAMSSELDVGELLDRATLAADAPVRDLEQLHGRRLQPHVLGLPRRPPRRHQGRAARAGARAQPRRAAPGAGAARRSPTRPASTSPRCWSRTPARRRSSS